MKLCTDCVHFRANKFTDAGANLDHCMRDGAKSSRVDLVRGDHKPGYCESERVAQSEGYCGPGAKFWEPAEGYFTPGENKEEEHV